MSLYSQIALLFGLATAIYAVCKAIYNLFLHPLRRFPGPRWRAVSELPYFMSLVRGTSPQDMAKLHEKYGPVVRVSPSELTFVSAQAFRDIYGHPKSGQQELRKDKKYYSAMGEPTLLHGSDPVYHSQLRKMLATGFSDTALRKQEDVIQRYLNLLIEKLKEQSQEGQQLDLVNWFNYFVFDVIGYLTYGDSFDCLNSSSLHRWIQLIPPLGRFYAFSQASERLPGLLKYLFLLFCVPRNIFSNVKEINEISQTKADHRVQHTPNVPDLMAKFVDEHKKGQMSMKQLRSNALFLVTAGSETLMTNLTHAVYHLVKNPHVIEKLTRELRSTFNSSDEITLVNLNRCKYLQAVIEETLRITAPSPASHPRYTPPGGITIDGHFVPGDMAVGISIFAACRYSGNFHESWKFVPERWTNEDAAYHSDAREAAQVFSVGPRDCLGRNLAYAEQRLVLARVLWHFDLEQRFPDNWADQKVYLVWEKPPCMVRLTQSQT